jgi:hypothetical protein
MALIAGKKIANKIPMTAMVKTISTSVKDLFLLFTLLCVVALLRCCVVAL